MSTIALIISLIFGFCMIKGTPTGRLLGKFFRALFAIAALIYIFFF